MGQVHVVTGPERRRRWTDQQKRVIVAAGDGSQVRLPASLSPALATALIKALVGR